MIFSASRMDVSISSLQIVLTVIHISHILQAIAVVMAVITAHGQDVTIEQMDTIVHIIEH